jgi:phosphatidylglycerophosphate synthase
MSAGVRHDLTKSFIPCRNFRLADLVTIMNGVCGSLSIFSSARYLLTNDIDDLWTALSFPLAGLMFDFFDGKVARWRKSSSMLGQELDSLADLVGVVFSHGPLPTKPFLDLIWSGSCPPCICCRPQNIP